MNHPLTQPADQILTEIRQHLRALNLHGLWVPKNDCHNSEYGDAEDNYLSFATGFTGSRGLALILMNRAYVFVDGRYTLQASKEVDSGSFEILNYKNSEIKDLCREIKLDDQSIGIIDTAVTLEESQRFESLCKLVPLGASFLNQLWINRPASNFYGIVDYPLTFAGKDRDEKIQALQKECAQMGVDGVFLNESNSIAWLLNLRSPSRPTTPAAHAFAFVPLKGKPILWAHKEEWPLNPADAIEWQSYGDMMAQMHRLLKGQTLWVDGDHLSLAQARGFEASGLNLFVKEIPVDLWKARKNRVEIEGAREAHRRDGAALCQFMAWLEGQDPTNLSEMDIVERILKYRQTQKDFQGTSFDTIAGFGPRGAIIHYHPTVQDHGRLAQENILLLDSGGHYLGGTTDVTRTIYIGSNPTAQQKEHYTRVLKGHIALTSAQFPKGTTGSQLDVLARHSLWQGGLDYAHGTGHGVGSFLGVHEGPQNISSVPNRVPLEEGMIVSNEPGYYLEGAYGIRIESLLLVKGSETPGFLCFETLTLAPLEYKLIERSMLDGTELAWLQAYHRKVIDEISPRVDKITQDYLRKCGKF